ncbi:hypothetical protein [Bacteroides reticulotermitis]|uniref:Nucleic acid-binding Zn ribbon protein n=1 Tax=Bacteroides reticulotermitis TaxID=1133319 RepID=A0A840CRX8_9BACE|nr:hypothetical protein [Bacteroides reticulotermitis]MBB4042767.1 putative nucleic acid-binding Zn ribbon protein [Bacteroides reticulotermitis]
MEEEKKPLYWYCPICQKEQEVIQLIGTYVQCSKCKGKFVIYLQEIPKPQILNSKNEKSDE